MSTNKLNDIRNYALELEAELDHQRDDFIEEKRKYRTALQSILNEISPGGFNTLKRLNEPQLVRIRKLIRDVL